MDIVDRLRERMAPLNDPDLNDEAADTIEALRAKVAELESFIENDAIERSRED